MLGKNQGKVKEVRSIRYFFLNFNDGFTLVVHSLTSVVVYCLKTFKSLFNV